MRKIINTYGGNWCCIETICKTGVKRVKMACNSAMNRSSSRTVTLTYLEKKILKKDDTGNRHAKRKPGI